MAPALVKQAVIGLLSAADRCRGHFTAILEPHGVTLQQFNVLRILRGAGGEGLPTLTIADRMIERSPGVTRLLDGLESRGYVKRRRCTEDRRRVYCEITSRGLELLGRLDAPIAQGDDACFAGLTEPDRRKLVALLLRVLPEVAEQG